MNWNNLLQLYGYSMFDNIVLNEGLNKEVVINTIMDKCAMSEPLYPDFDILTMKVNNFFLKNKLTIDKLYQAYTTEYNFIENYDRIEEHSTQRNSDNINKVSPYDDNNFYNDSQATNNDVTTINSRIHGNIGVTTAAAMLRENIELLPRLNVYETIADMFYNEFCIFVM